MQPPAFCSGVPYQARCVFAAEQKADLAKQSVATDTAKGRELMRQVMQLDRDPKNAGTRPIEPVILEEC